MTTIKMAEWWQAVPAWLAAGGPQQSRRWLKQFREFCDEHDLGEVESGFHVGYALDECCAAWEAANEAERAAVVDNETWRALRLAFREGRLASQVARREASDARRRELCSNRRWTLMAGENTQIIGSGTLDEVKVLYRESDIPLRHIAAVIVTCDSGERVEWQVQGPRVVGTVMGTKFVHETDSWPL